MGGNADTIELIPRDNCFIPIHRHTCIVAFTLVFTASLRPVSLRIILRISVLVSYNIAIYIASYNKHIYIYIYICILFEALHR